MVERRHVRVLVPYSRTLYYNDKGRERGITADIVRDFEQYINKKYAKELGKRPITVFMILTTRDELLQDVADGLGDIAAGNLTVTDARKKIVDFVAPARSEAGVGAGRDRAEVARDRDRRRSRRQDRARRKASSYYESLVALNDRLKKAGKPPAKLVLVPDALEDEDMLEMLNAGCSRRSSSTTGRRGSGRRSCPRSR